MVTELLHLFKAGFLPMSTATPLGEKERAAAFSKENPLAWIKLCPPATASTPACTPAKKIFGFWPTGL